MKKIVLSLFFFVNKLIFRMSGIKGFDDFQIKGILFVKNHGELLIGPRFKANSGYRFNPIGGSHTLSLVVLKNANLSIGENVGISNSAIFCSYSIDIGNDVLIGGDCKIYDTDFHSLNFNERIRGTDVPRSSPVVIGDGAFIGAGSTILKGVTIGKYSVIGAGSVVSKSVPDGQVWGGNPCRYIRDI
ncbi:acyltransferase [Vibrio vulnificus]|nr:acyltransferase [Vibrio vulnificus]